MFVVTLSVLIDVEIVVWMVAIEVNIVSENVVVSSKMVVSNSMVETEKLLLMKETLLRLNTLPMESVENVTAVTDGAVLRASVMLKLCLLVEIDTRV